MSNFKLQHEGQVIDLLPDGDLNTKGPVQLSNTLNDDVDKAAVPALVNQVNTTATTAAAKANAADAAAASATTTADAALKEAQDANQAATNAVGAATTAAAKANAAAAKAETAAGTANTAAGTVSGAIQDANAALQKAQEALTQATAATGTATSIPTAVFEDGGAWTPSAQKEYPDKPANSTIWFIKLAHAGDTYTFKTGDLVAEQRATVSDSSMLYYDKITDKFYDNQGGNGKISQIVLPSGTKSGNSVSIDLSDIADNLNNWGASSALNNNSATTYATSKAVHDLNALVEEAVKKAEAASATATNAASAASAATTAATKANTAAAKAEAAAAAAKSETAAVASASQKAEAARLKANEALAKANEASSDAASALAAAQAVQPANPQLPHASENSPGIVQLSDNYTGSIDKNEQYKKAASQYAVGELFGYVKREIARLQGQIDALKP